MFKYLFKKFFKKIWYKFSFNRRPGFGEWESELDWLDFSFKKNQSLFVQVQKIINILLVFVEIRLLKKWENTH